MDELAPDLSLSDEKPKSDSEVGTSAVGTSVAISASSTGTKSKKSKKAKKFIKSGATTS